MNAVKPKIAVSFSGGRTSAYMTQRIMREFKDTHEIVVTFANTGLEHEKTLEFVNNCDKHMGFGTVWLEAVVDPRENKGTRHKVVTFETAARKGEPFEEVIKKYGIPNPGMGPICTRELKETTLRSYRRSLGWKKRDYQTAIGIRADEIDRINENAIKNLLWYPLVSWGICKNDVKTFWSKQSFDLNLDEHYGNCVTCWKKSDRKLLTIAKETPSAFDFMDRMEKQYPYAGAGDGPRTFFRKYRSVQDLLALSKQPFRSFVPGLFQLEMFDPDMDQQSSCGESCEIGADEN